MQSNGASPSDLPSVGKLLETRPIRELADEVGISLATSLVREILDELRTRVLAGEIDRGTLESACEPAAIARRARNAATALLRPAPSVVINATGVVAHTNLGRSILSPGAAGRVAEAAVRYLDLEYDLVTGTRGSRGSHLEPLLARLFPGCASLAVNNNAAAILLALRALARGKEVVVSRGELVEIGGSFRVPDILAASGARLREVGTTNRTRAADYEAALGPKTGAILKVHTSNFKVVGFTEEAPIAALAGIARAAGIPLIVDWGSGDLVDLAPVGIHDEVPVRRLLEDGASVVTFSGDKLLGGPQAGIAVGERDLIRAMKRDPLARALRLDRLLTAALHETLASYVRGRALDEVPTLRMLALPKERVAARARALVDALGGAQGVSIVDGVSRPGGGSSPVGEIPTALIAVERSGGELVRIERALRRGEPSIVARIQDGVLLLDLRTVLEDEDPIVATRLREELLRARGAKK
ncbi:MAG TPA: L-seryl-tRNA(Sec) selenium transferase [Candidatus Polarisedimenticolaceae bacterium]